MIRRFDLGWWLPGELYGLTSQLRRCGASIPANLKPKDHAELSQRATELKRMLTALIQKLRADR